MRNLILITIFLLFGMSTTASAQNLTSIQATDVLRVSYNNFHATIELQDNSVGVILSSINYSGEAAKRCLDLASDLESGQTPVTNITFYFDYQSVLTGSSGSVTSGETPTFTHSPLTYTNVRIINCSADKPADEPVMLGDVNLSLIHI